MSLVKSMKEKFIKKLAKPWNKKIKNKIINKRWNIENVDNTNKKWQK